MLPSNDLIFANRDIVAPNDPFIDPDYSNPETDLYLVILNTNPFFNEFDGAGFHLDAEENFDIFKINLIINSEPID